MSLSIQFDSEPAFRTIKVDNVAIYAELSPKFLAKQLAALKRFPEDGFGGSQRFAKLVSTGGSFGCIEDTWFVSGHERELCKMAAN